MQRNDCWPKKKEVKRWLRIFIEKHKGEKTGNSLQQLRKEAITEVCVHNKSCRRLKFNQGGFRRHIKSSFLRGGQENISAPLMGPCPAASLPPHSEFPRRSGPWGAAEKVPPGQQRGQASSQPPFDAGMLAETLPLGLVSLPGFLFSYTLAFLVALWCPKDVLYALCLPCPWSYFFYALFLRFSSLKLLA